MIDDRCRTSDPDIFAIGECALLRRPHLRPGRARLPHGRRRRRRASPAADQERFRGSRHEHQAQAARRRRGQLRRRVRRRDARRARGQLLRRPGAASTRSWCSRADGKRLLGGMLVGDATGYGAAARNWRRQGSTLPPHPEELILPARAGGKPASLGVDGAARRGHHLLVPQRQQGRHLRRHRRREAGQRVRGQDLHQGRHRLRLVRDAGDRAPRRRAQGRPASSVSNHLCEHFAYSRQELYSARPAAQASSRSTSCSSRHGRGAAARSASRRWRRSSPRRGTSTCSSQAAPAAAGHQRSLPGQHPARRHLLGRAARARAARSRPTS